MNVKNYITIATAVIVAVSLFAGGFLPIIADASTTTETITNEGAGWLRMNYMENNSDYSVNVSLSDDTLTVGAQSGEASDMIVYADSDSSVVLVDGSMYLINSSGSTELPDSFSIERSSGAVSVNNVQTSENVSYAYVPRSGGNYAYFDAEGMAPLHRSGEALATMGTFAGLTVTNNYSPYGLVMDADVTTEYINSVRWALPGDLSMETTLPVIIPGGSTILPFNPGSSTDDIDLEPVDLDLGENTIMSVPPTPSYTDGDWGYNLSGSDATIVSYSGPSGTNVDITIPSTVGGYTVKKIGNGSTAIFDTSLTFGSLSITEGIENLNTYAFRGCSGFKGSLTIPGSVKTINDSAFDQCSGFKGSLTIPEGVLTVGNYSFRDCAGFDRLVVPTSVTTWGDYVFYRDSGLKTAVIGSNAIPKTNTFSTTTNLKIILDLSTVEYTTTSYGLNANEIHTVIEGSGFLAPIEVNVSVGGSGPASTILAISPVIIAGGLVLGILSVMVLRRI